MNWLDIKKRNWSHFQRHFLVHFWKSVQRCPEISVCLWSKSGLYPAVTFGYSNPFSSSYASISFTRKGNSCSPPKILTVSDLAVVMQENSFPFTDTINQVIAVRDHILYSLTLTVEDLEDSLEEFTLQHVWPTFTLNQLWNINKESILIFIWWKSKTHLKISKLESVKFNSDHQRRPNQADDLVFQ